VIDLLTPARGHSTLLPVHADGDASPLPADEALRALRELLAQGADRAALRAAAAQLGVSIPALEQRLSAAGTSFKNELRQARVKEAQRLLLSTVHTTTAIATQLGFPSLQHFTVEFRKLTGEAPGSWRARRS
jgi:AraC-like DNA-binding protein